MGCGRTNTTGNKINVPKKGFLEKKHNYEQCVSTFEKFIEKNPLFSNEIKFLKPKEVEAFVTQNEALLKQHQITRKVVVMGIMRILHKSLLEKVIMKSSCFNELLNVIDKINQTDSDIKLLKQIASDAPPKFFHKPNEIKLYTNIDLGLFENDDLVVSVLEQIKYEMSNQLVNITVRIPISQINNGCLLIEIADLIENSVNIASCAILVENRYDKYCKVNINSLLPVTSSIRNNSSIKNIGFCCYNCKGVMSSEMQNEITYLLSDSLFSAGFGNLELKEEVTDYFLERIADMKHLKILLFEPICDLSESVNSGCNDDDLKNILLNKIANALHDTDSLELIYLGGFDDCSQDIITKMINILRKKGTVKSVIVDKKFDFAIKKYYSD